MTSVFRSPTLRGFAHEIEGARSSNNFLNGTNGTVPNANEEINGSFRSVDEEYARDAQTLAEYLPKRFLSRQSQPLMDSSTNLTVFLTGATGFLGAFILKDLLSRKSASLKVIAHVRSKKSKTPFERVRNTCQAYGIWSDSWSSKIECVTGNLGDRRLGMEDHMWQRIANEADVVIHNGAQVHWVLPYSNLKAQTFRRLWKL